MLCTNIYLNFNAFWNKYLYFIQPKSNKQNKFVRERVFVFCKPIRGHYIYIRYDISKNLESITRLDIFFSRNFTFENVFNQVPTFSVWLPPTEFFI